LQAPADPLVITLVAPAGTAEPPVITPVAAAEAPTDSLAVTVPAAPAVGGAQGLDGSLPAGPAPPPGAAAGFSPPHPHGPGVVGEFAVGFLMVPLPPETEGSRAVAAAPTGGDHPNDARDAFFAQLADQEVFPDLLGGDPSPPRA